MHRVAVLLAVGLLAGCGPAPSSNPAATPAAGTTPTGLAAKDAGPVAATAQLTQDQAEAWAKLRREYKGRDSYCLVYCTASNRVWRGIFVENEKWPSSGPESAASLAADVDVKAVAGVDLLGDPAPKVLRWFYDDGKAVEQSATPPTAEIGNAANAFLHDLQTRADKIRPGLLVR